MAKRATPVTVTRPPLPPEREHPLVLIHDAGAQDHISDFYEAEPGRLLEVASSLYDASEGDVYVYKLVPYAVLEGVPATFKVKE